MPIRPSLAAAMAAALALLTPCAGCTRATPPPTGIAKPETTPRPNTTDIAWAQLMVAMNDRALRLLARVPTRAANPALVRLTSEIAAEHQAEQPRLRRLLTRNGPEPTNPHKDHDMPGMITRADLATTETLRGPALDHLVTTRLHAHLAQSALITNGERTSGADPAALTLATEISRTRSSQLTALSHLAPQRGQSSSQPLPQYQ
jgi:uncharacterized protein (DUF305 family)